jgi:hypothetical protein
MQFIRKIISLRVIIYSGISNYLLCSPPIFDCEAHKYLTRILNIIFKNRAVKSVSCWKYTARGYSLDHSRSVCCRRTKSEHNTQLFTAESVIESVTKIKIKISCATRIEVLNPGLVIRARCVSNWSSVIFQDSNASLSLARLSVLQAKSGRFPKNLHLSYIIRAARTSRCRWVVQIVT